MKNLLLILICCAFLVSFRTEAQVQNSNFTKAVKVTNESIWTPPKISPFDSTKADIKSSKIGAVESGKRSVCLRIENPNLKDGEKIQIVLPELPQKSFEAEISKKAACAKDNFGVLDDNGVTDYLLKSSAKKFLNRGRGIGVVTTQKVKMNGKFATLDLNGDKKSEYFRECTSMEGLHLTVWTGKPLVGKGIWHAYYGLGYDTVPTCKKRDFYGKDN